MLKRITLALVLGSFIPGFVSAAYACGGNGCGSGGNATCSMDMGGDASGTMDIAAPTTAAAKSPAVANRPTRRSYRSYSYQPSYSGVRMGGSRGSSSGVRGAGSKSLGNYGR